MIWVLLLSLINDQPRDREIEIEAENTYEVEFYESPDERDNESETSSEDLITQVSDFTDHLNADFLYNLGGRSVWISQHLIRYFDDPEKVHYCENNVCFICENEDYSNLDPTTKFYNDARFVITHKYENSENEVDIEENIFFETLDEWTIYNVKFFKNNFNEPTVEITMQYRGSNYVHLKQICFNHIENTEVVDFKFIYYSDD